MRNLSGRALKIPYSFSRWTDVPAAKWGWFKERLAEESFLGFTEGGLTPGRWSLLPSETEKIVLWTRNPRRLLADKHLLEPYSVHIHYTLTGWVEAEPGSPSPEEGLKMLGHLLEAFGPDNVTWRFTPIPTTLDVLDRWAAIATQAASLGVKHTTVSFLHKNGPLMDLRSEDQREELLKSMAEVLSFSICEKGTSVVGVLPCQGPSSHTALACGCRPMVDPFSINESCVYGCRYCYAADTTLALQRRDTTLNTRT